MTATFYVGDAIEVMSKLPEKSVDLVLSSPPFLALRSYLPADHPDKAKEGGSQATPGEYIDWLVDVAEACARVLAPHGSLCFELGDTYAGSGAGGGDVLPDSLGAVVNHKKLDSPDSHIVFGRKGDGWPLPKSLSLIPELFRFTLVYGVNPLTGRQTDRWRLRNVIRWVRPNPPVGALGDKFRPATSELMVFCKSAKRYFDLDAVRDGNYKPRELKVDMTRVDTRDQARKEVGLSSGKLPSDNNPAGAPPLDWWSIPLLEGDEPSKYGPKPPESTAGGPYRPGRKPVPDRNPSHGWGDSPQGRENPAGAPPLDWWEISPDRQPCEHGQFEPHQTYIVYGGMNHAAEYEPWKCPGGSRGWEISLDGEEAKPYGPGEKERQRLEAEKLRPRRGDKAKETGFYGANTADNPLGSPPLDWWNIPPGGYEGAHYAVFPPELCVKPIKAMCPETVCRTCGEPRRRITESERIIGGKVATEDTPLYQPGRASYGGGDYSVTSSTTYATQVTTLGFSDCGHDNYRPGLVLDPFAGSGTTLAVATGHGRDAIGIDLDERNYELALQRVGPLVLEQGVL